MYIAMIYRISRLIIYLYLICLLFPCTCEEGLHVNKFTCTCAGVAIECRV